MDGKVVGISLGSDFCAEHEWGIKGLKRMLGMDGWQPEFSREKVAYKKGPGLPRRTISKHDCVKLYEHKGAVALICESDWWFKSFEENIAKHGKAKAFKEYLPHDLPKRDELGSAWSGDDFGIYGTGANAERIKDLYAEIQKNNVAVWIGGAKIFDNGGLILCIVDRVPKEHADTLMNADLDGEKLKAASDATGIIERLKNAKKGFYACSPSWFDGKFKPQNQQKKSVHPVIYWLNPEQQDRINYGWFTVEELDQWIAGTGPIPKQMEVSS